MPYQSIKNMPALAADPGSARQKDYAHPIEKWVQDQLQQGITPYDIRLLLEEAYEVPSELLDKYFPSAKTPHA